MDDDIIELPARIEPFHYTYVYLLHSYAHGVSLIYSSNIYALYLCGNKRE